MIKHFLLPNRFKLVGWCLLLPTTFLGIILMITEFEASWLNTTVFALIYEPILGKSQTFSFIIDNITNELIAFVFIIGALYVGFSKEKVEDEFVANLRLSSLLWAVGVNYILLLLSLLFIYGAAFYTVMVYNIFTVLIIFITRFNYILYRNSKLVSNEK